MNHQARLKIKGFFGVPATPPFTKSIMADMEWNGALKRHAVHQLSRYDLNQENTSIDEEEKFRAISLSYKVHSNDNYVNDWTVITTQEELTLRNEAIDHYSTVVDDLLNDIDNITPEQSRQLADYNTSASIRSTLATTLNISADDQTKLWDAVTQVHNLTVNAGYLENPPDAFGDGRAAVYRPLNTANIPFRYQSNFKTGRNQPFTLWLYRYKPNENQSDQYLHIDWGFWRLAFSGDNDVKLYRFDERLTAAQRTALDNQLKQVLDGGRLTQVDKAYIQSRKDDISALKKTAHDEKRKLTTEEKSSIQSKKDEITAKREEKKNLSQADESLAASLKKRLYRQSEDVNLHDSAKNLFNHPLIITFLPQQRGLLAIKLEGNDPYIFEDKTITKTRNFDDMWGEVPITISGNGGALTWKYGNPAFAKAGSFTLNPFSVGYDAGTGEGIPIQGYWENYPNTDVQFLIEQTTPEQVITVSGGQSYTVPPSYTLTVNLTSDGKYAPYIYRADLEIPADDRDGSDVVVWDSLDHLDEGGNHPILEVNPQFDEGGKRVTYEIIVRNFEDTLGLPAPLHDRLIDILIDNQIVLKNGIIREATYEFMEAADSLSSATQETQVRIIVQDMIMVLDDDLMTESPIGDGQALGAYIRQILKGRGIKDSEMSGVPASGNAAGKILPQAGPAEKAAVRPSKGNNRGSYIRSLVEQYGMELEFFYDGPNGTFTLTERSTTIKKAFVSTGTDLTTLVFEPLHRPQDYTDFYNYFKVEGAKDPETGKRIVAEWVVWESINVPSDARYIGRIRRSQTHTDDALLSDEEVQWVLRSLVKKNTRLGSLIQFKAQWYHIGLYPGDRVTLDGILTEIVRIPSASMSENEMAFVCREILPTSA